MKLVSVLRPYRGFGITVPIALAFAGLVMGTVTASAAQPDCVEGNSGSVTFVVVDPNTELPVADPDVELFPLGQEGVSDWRYTARSGRVTVCDLPPGTYGYRVTHSRSDDVASGRVRIPSSGSDTVPVWLQGPRGLTGADAERRPPDTAASACPDDVAEEARRKLAHNNALVPGSGSVMTQWMARVPSCTESLVECHQRARDAYDRCPPGADGTYTECSLVWQRTNIACSNDEIRCTQRALGCGQPSGPADSGPCTQEIRDRAREKLAHNNAQVPGSGSVMTQWMSEVPACTEALVDCHQRARDAYDRCPPGADGTYTECSLVWQRTNIACSNEEIRCTLAALGCS